MSLVEHLELMTALHPEPRSGDLVGNCPICGARNELLVNPERDLFVCFGCDALGGTEDLYACLTDGPPRDGTVMRMVFGAAGFDGDAA